MEKKVLYTPEQLAEWKDKYGADALREVTFEDNEGNSRSAVIRKPTRTVIAAFSSTAAKDNDKALQSMVKNCLLVTDIEDLYAENNADCFFAVAKAVQDLIAVRNEEVKKL